MKYIFRYFLQKKNEKRRRKIAQMATPAAQCH